MNELKIGIYFEIIKGKPNVRQTFLVNMKILKGVVFTLFLAWKSHYCYILFVGPVRGIKASK